MLATTPASARWASAAAGSGRRSAVVVLRMAASAGDTTSRPRPRRPSASARDSSNTQGLDARRVGLLDQVQRPAQPAMPG